LQACLRGVKAFGSIRSKGGTYGSRLLAPGPSPYAWFRFGGQDPIAVPPRPITLA
jgi:hypothetical protein